MPKLAEAIDDKREGALVESQGEMELATLYPKQAVFCREYLIDFNASAAARRAGYSERTANEQGSRLLTKASVQMEIRRLIDERTRRVEIDADWVVKNLVENVQRSMQAVAVRDSEGNPIEYRYNGAVANKALELLGKHLGMFLDKHRIEQGVQQSDNFPSLSELLMQVEETRKNQIITGELEDEVTGYLEHTERQ